MATHPSPELPQALVDKIVERRGHLHAYAQMDPSKTALVVIDMDIGSCRREPAAAAAALAKINALAAALRAAGGRVAYVTSTIGEPENLTRRLGEQRAASYVADTQPGGLGTLLDPGLHVDPADLRSTKLGASAFFPGRCDLQFQLASIGVTSVLIAGMVTNVCCESSARDATELGYEVTMVSDACVGQSFGLHEASLSTFFRFFGDVRPVADVLGLFVEPEGGAGANHRGWIVLDSIMSEDGTMCVDVFEDPAGGFGFEHLRSDPEDGGRWTAVGGFSSTRYASGSDAIEMARKSVVWLGKGQIR